MTTILAALGWDPAAYRCPEGHEPGRVTRADRGVSTVLTARGEVRASLGGNALNAAAADPSAMPCAGDWVALRFWPDARATIEAILPRRTAIVRRTAGKAATGQVLAANMDTAAVVASVDPMPELATIERLLSLAWDSGARPCVILTKCDLALEPELIAEQLSEIAPGLPVIPVSAERGDGMQHLRPLVKRGRTLALIGASGAGKSTLVNALAGSEVMPTQAIRRVDGKGRHTTTHRALIPVPGGGAILDTPGVRSVGLLEGVQGIDLTFADIVELARQCRFPDCRHQGEPGCAIALALASGELSHRRWTAWLKLHREVAFERRRVTRRRRRGA